MVTSPACALKNCRKLQKDYVRTASIRAEIIIRDLPNTCQKHDRLSQLSRPGNEIHSCLVLIKSGQIRQISHCDIMLERNNLLNTVVDSKDWLSSSQWFRGVRKGPDL